jgi:hypothetical protein
VCYVVGSVNPKLICVKYEVCHVVDSVIPKVLCVKYDEVYVTSMCNAKR